MYNETVIDHFKHPRNAGRLDDADGVGDATNPACGDIAKLFIKVAGDRITDARFQTFGCSACIATSSMVTLLCIGRTLAEARAVTGEAVAAALGGLPSGKMHCASLAADVLQVALDDYAKRAGGA
ncbi:MAG: iron-sulfur cluster assembly scaffold protein [Deltaproteobacteria bacterium]|nr:iron-sulfur cluster assembly scaffold protein [Deltaproteobacteria bacterium]